MSQRINRAVFALLVGVMIATTGAVSADASDVARDTFWTQMLDRD
jgi:hypothetical protein